MNALGKRPFSSTNRTPRLAVCLRAVGLLVASAWATTAAQATPVGFADSTMSMGEFSRDFKEIVGVYTFTRSDALALGWEESRFRHGGHDKKLRLAEIHYNRLLQRWNGPESQANLFVLLGLGAASGSGVATLTQSAAQSQNVWLPGFQFDYETRRVYFALKGHAALGLDTPAGGKKLSQNRRSVSAGFSFYKTEYDEWQPWLIAEVKRNTLKPDVESTLYLRGIHKTLFVEGGVGFAKANRGDLQVNFRYTF
jgi:hypothetical protein